MELFTSVKELSEEYISQLKDIEEKHKKDKLKLNDDLINCTTTEIACLSTIHENPNIGDPTSLWNIVSKFKVNFCKLKELEVQEKRNLILEFEKQMYLLLTQIKSDNVKEDYSENGSIRSEATLTNVIDLDTNNLEGDPLSNMGIELITKQNNAGSSINLNL